MMDKMRPIKEYEGGEQAAQVFYVDGCKVTIRYSEQKNPSAIKNIKGALLAGITLKKS